MFERLLNLHKINGSLFIFGPRMTGKTSLLRGLTSQLFINLLDPETHLELQQSPKHFWEQLGALKKNNLVILDEVQRVPVLLDYVQRGLDEKHLRFILSGSSARKLRRGGANLLGGRAQDLRLHPLTHREVGERFDLALVLQFGSLPKIADLVLQGRLEEARQYLRAYYTTYIKEEIQAEALTRNVGAFQRFLAIAAQSNGQVIEFANISRECGVPMSTVKEYYSILEDTLLGDFLWPWGRSERKKSRPKFYFFDTGVIRSLQNRLVDPPTPSELGFLFETWFVREAIKLRDYAQSGVEFFFWREGKHEIDLIASKNGVPVLAVECKTGVVDSTPAACHLFKEKFPAVPLVITSLQDANRRRLDSGVFVEPWKNAVEMVARL